MKENINKKSYLDRIPSFSLMLTMVILMIIGIGLTPFIDVTNTPKPRQGKNLAINFNWPGTSPRIVEQEVTSRIEGIVSSVHGVKSVTSVSYLGKGRVNIELKEGVNVSAVRFEISSLIKQIYKKLPEKVSYPSLTGGDTESGLSSKPTTKNLLSYRINADMDGEQIKEYIEYNVKPILSTFEEVKGVHVSGGVTKYMEIAYDPLVLLNYGLTSSAIADGIKTFIGKNDIVGDIETIDRDEERRRITLHLSTSKFSKQIGEIPLTMIGDKIIYLNDLATYEYKEKEPKNYFRINGLNTIYMNISVDADANMIRLSKNLKTKIEEIKPNLRKGVYLTLTHDASEEMETELRKLIRRTLFSLLILLLFVWIVSRSGKYLSIIALTLTANILIAAIIYYLWDIRLHTFSLAGIAVSFGIIIDSSIVMIDHYSYYRDRKAFLAILAALLTTIGSLIIIFFMPDYIQRDLYDFSRIIIINLTVALFIALLFIPATVQQFGYNRRKQILRIKQAKKYICWNRFYYKYISFTQKRKWIYMVFLILAFGIPFFALPDKWPQEKGKHPLEEENRWYASFYNKTIGSDFYQNYLNKPLNTYLGGTMRLFSNSLSGQTYKAKERDIILTIKGEMPLGGTACQLNDKVVKIEKFLAKFKEIKRFETRIDGGGTVISVEFEEEFKKTMFPYYFESSVIGELINIGGADWSTSGVSERGFSNSLHLGQRNHRIELKGYNYNRLYKYAEELSRQLSLDNHVTDIIIENAGQTKVIEELYMNFDRENIAIYQVDIEASYNRLKEILSTTSLGYFSSQYINTNLELHSKRMEQFDLWNLSNSYLRIGDRDIAYRYIGNIAKRNAKNSIPKKNQEYMLTVAFNFSGNWNAAERYIDKTTENFNSILPVGYRCNISSWGWYKDDGTQYWLILLIVVIIFFMCAILFESIRLPFVIISLIPVSFIGTFLTFYFGGINFGTGGFASLVLLCGLVVNSGIYIINEYNYLQNIYSKQKFLKSKITLYIKAYNHKIIPVFLTILSTVLGLIPFLTDGDTNEFWFSFAIGTSGGLIFSIIALIFIMPIFMSLEKNSPRHYQKE